MPTTERLKECLLKKTVLCFNNLVIYSIHTSPIWIFLKIFSHLAQNNYSTTSGAKRDISRNWLRWKDKGFAKSAFHNALD